MNETPTESEQMNQTTDDNIKAELETLRKALFGEKRQRPTNLIPHPQPKEEQQ